MLLNLIMMKTKALFPFLLLAVGTAAAQQNLNVSMLRPDNDRMVVISGGGARGAWGVGFLQGMLAHTGIRYTTAFGTSTGSLMAPFILTNDTAKLRKGYSGVRQGDIFNVNPFKINEKNGVVQSKLRGFNAAYRLLISKKKTLGESLPLKQRIQSFMDSAEYVKIKSQNLNLSVAVTNMSTGGVEIKSINDFGYSDMCNWMWASANEPIWMSYYVNNGNYYVDGGIRDVIPLRQAVATAFVKKYTHIDVVINNSDTTLDPFPDSQRFTWLTSLIRVLDIYGQGTISNDVTVGKYMEALHNLELKCNNVNVNCDTCEGVPLKITFYFMPEPLAKKYRNELAFFPDLMEVLYQEGLKAGSDPENKKDHLLKMEFQIINRKNTELMLK